MDNRQQVMWSDKLRFWLRYANGRVRIWRKQYESNAKCIVTTFHDGGGNMIVFVQALDPQIRVYQSLNKISSGV